jgi:hypothetical protein
MVPTDDDGGHAVGDKAAATLRHLQPELVSLPPAHHRAGGVGGVPVVLPDPRALGRERDVRGDAGDAAGHLIDALREKVRDRRKFVTVHVGKRDLCAAVVDVGDHSHLLMHRGPASLTLPEQFKDAL